MPSLFLFTKLMLTEVFVFIYLGVKSKWFRHWTVVNSYVGVRRWNGYDCASIFHDILNVKLYLLTFQSILISLTYVAGVLFNILYILMIIFLNICIVFGYEHCCNYNRWALCWLSFKMLLKPFHIECWTPHNSIHANIHFLKTKYVFCDNQ